VPTIAQKRLATNTAIHLLKLDSFWLNVIYPNRSAPPTDNLKFRQAVRANVEHYIPFYNPRMYNVWFKQ
jgi:peptide/nickel transport system substrate-binding protein